MIQNIIFDFDDTLFCTNELGKKTLKLLCKKMKLPFDEKKYSTMKGLSRKDRLKKLFPNQYKYMWKKWDLEYKKAFKKEVKPIDKDTIPTLKTLSKKYTLFIFSTKQDFLIKIALRKYNILRLFKQIVGSENVKNKKPHKEGFNKILKQNQIDKNEIILVGDSQIDIKTAQNCNIPLIILSKQKIRAKKVNQITNITEIEKAIKKFEPQKQSQFKILITFRHKHWNGQAGCVLRLANELRKVGHKIEFICPKSSAFAKKAIQLKFSIAGFIELNIKPKNKGFNKQKNKLKKIILTQSPDIIQTNGPRDMEMTALALKEIKQKPKFIRIIHSSIPLKAKKITTWIFTKMLDAVIVEYKTAINEVLGTLIKQKVLNKNKIIISQGSFDIEKMSAFRQTNYNQKKTIIGYIGRIEKDKGIFYLLKAIKSLSEKDFCLWIAGTGSLEKDAIEFVEKNNLQSKIKFFGFVEDIRPILNKISFLVLPSISCDASSTTVKEALFFKKPVIATSIGGIAEIITNNKNGHIIQPRNSKALAKAILELMKSKTKTTRMGKYGWKKLKTFSPKQPALTLNKCYVDLYAKTD